MVYCTGGFECARGLGRPLEGRGQYIHRLVYFRPPYLQIIRVVEIPVFSADYS